MVILKGRLAANRANALRSTGPRTAAGKARSRANSFKHGMTGEGVVLPDEASAQSVAARASELRRAFATDTLARRLGVLSDRLDRLDRRDRADTAIRVRRAGIEAAESRQVDVDALVERMPSDPDVSVRRLLMSAEGCDRLIELWEGLGRELDPGRGWSDAHVGLARSLAGRQDGARAGGRFDVLADLAGGGDRHLPADDQLEDPAYRGRVAEGARLALLDLVAEQIDGVEGRRAELPRVDAETELAELADLALFDESGRGLLFRRYEQATERHLFRTLVELERLAEGEAPETLPELPEPPMGSFGEMANPPSAGVEEEPEVEPEAPLAPAFPTPKPRRTGRRGVRSTSARPSGRRKPAGGPGLAGPAMGRGGGPSGGYPGSVGGEIGQGPGGGDRR